MIFQDSNERSLGIPHEQSKYSRDDVQVPIAFYDSKAKPSYVRGVRWYLKQFPD